MPEMDELYQPPVPDALDAVVETADLIAAFAAQRLVRVDAMHRESLADAARYGRSSTATRPR
ncbi:hypothetical protein [Microbacterium lushaniae]|uniref:hypothetical protein n=1 Tax=Microbacterium lushaniae TaxID=2614639 RepID=UPI001EE7DBE4|nr:hypothetical protein [Microbacterium lushaniae]